MLPAAYISDDDLFDAAAVRNARAIDDAVRELAPVVKLARENITMIARYEHLVTARATRNSKVGFNLPEALSRRGRRSFGP